MGFKLDEIIKSPQLKSYIEQLKIAFKFLAVGFIAILALGMGFIIMVAGILFMPIIKWWALKNIDKEVEVVKKGDFIEVDYEVVDEEEKHKNKLKDKE